MTLTTPETFSPTARQLFGDERLIEGCTEIAALLGRVPFIENRTFSLDELKSRIATPAGRLACSGLIDLKPSDVGQDTMRITDADLLPDPRSLITIRHYGNAEHKVQKFAQVPPALYTAFVAMRQVMTQDDPSLQLFITSGYRSPAYQLGILCYNLKENPDNFARVFRKVALPFYSEHSSITSPAIDVDNTLWHPACYEDTDFAETREYAWMSEHAEHFGFTLSYPENNTQGIAFEPWHWRYIGKDRLQLTL